MKKKNFKELFLDKVGQDFLDVLSHAKNYVSAEVLSKGLAFLTLPVFTRLLTPQEYGVMSVFLSFITVLSIIVGFGFRGSISRYYYEPHKDFYGFFSSNFWFVIISAIFIGIIVLFNKAYLQRFLNIPLGMIFLSIAIIIPQALFELYQSYLQAAKRSKRVASLNLLNAVVITFLSIGLMYLMDDERYYGKAIAQLVGVMLIGGITFFSIKNHLSLKIKKSHIKYSLIFGIPIVLHLLSNYILTTFDQIIINNIVGQKETGFYSIAYRIGMIQSIISAGVLKALTPIFYEKMNCQKFEAIKMLEKKYSYFVLVIALLLIFFSKEIINVLVEKSFSEALDIVPIIITAYYFSFAYTIYVNYAFYEKQTRNIAIFTIISGVVNISLNYSLIPVFGYKIAAVTTLISFIILFLLHFVNVKYFTKSSNLVSIETFLIPIGLLTLMNGSYYGIMSLSVGYWGLLILRLAIASFFLLLIVNFIRKLNT